MKSNNVLIGIALVFLALAVTVSATVWGDISSAVKIGMYAFGFSTGIAAGVIFSRRKETSQ